MFILQISQETFLKRLPRELSHCFVTSKIAFAWLERTIHLLADRIVSLVGMWYNLCILRPIFITDDGFSL